MRLAGVIFDFDGVIVNSLAMHIRAWNAAFAQMTGEELSQEQKKAIAGKSTRAIAHLLSQCSDRITPATIAEAKAHHLIDDQIAVPILPGVQEVFGLLRKSNVPYGIASNAPRNYVKNTISTLQLDVDVALGIEDAGRPKPAPDLYLAAAKLLGIGVSQHRNVLVFEDSTHGLRAAEDAGMQPQGVTTMHGHDALMAAGALRTCAHLQEAMALGFFED